MEWQKWVKIILRLGWWKLAHFPHDSEKELKKEYPNINVTTFRVNVANYDNVQEAAVATEKAMGPV